MYETDFVGKISFFSFHISICYDIYFLFVEKDIEVIFMYIIFNLIWF